MESNSTKIRWTRLSMFSASDRHDHATEMELRAALREFRSHGCVRAWCFDRIGAEHEDDDQSTWGPEDEDAVDWSGFDIPLAIRSQPSRMPRGGTAWIVYRTDTGDMISSSQSEESERDRLAYYTSDARFDGGVTYRLATEDESRLPEWHVYDTRTEPETDAGLFCAVSAESAISAAVREIDDGLNDCAPSASDLRAVRRWHWEVRDEGASDSLVAETRREARAAAREYLRGGDYGTIDRTIWVDGYLQREDEDDWETVTIQIDPDEPVCEDDQEHDWRAVDVVGHGCGVIHADRCRHCGVRRITDTWAQRPDTGEQGLTSVRYEREDDE